MSDERSRKPRELIVRAAERGALLEESLRHPFDASSELHAYALARHVGLARVGVNLVRVPPGRSSYPLHAHEAEEEWLFVLSGKGALDIGGETFDLGAGDFAGFPAGLYAHHVRNPGPGELVYLCGGERAPVDVIDYPRVGHRGLRVVRVGRQQTVFPAGAGEPLAPVPRGG
jgi:uncharacterized cupin superfamily protein